MIMVAIAVATAFISVNGAVAALLPVVVMAAIRLRHQPSGLLLPMVFAAHAGSMLALTGTPVNVIVSDAAVDAGADRFGYFDFALVGVPLLAGTVTIVLLFGHRLVPDRQPRSIPPDFSEHARTLVQQYGGMGRDEALFTRDTGVAEVVVPPRSALIGANVFPGMVTDSGTLVVVAVQRHGEDREGETVAGGGRHPAARRGPGRPSREPRPGGGAGRRPARPGTPADGPGRPAGQDRGGHPRRDGRAAGHRRHPAGGGRACSRPVR
jgi:hypothetical protein